MARERVFILGAGKVGRALDRALRARRHKVTLRAARAGLPPRVRADLVILAVRDRDLGSLAAALAERIDPAAACVHVAGALGPEALEPLRGRCAGVAQMHPMIAFASLAHFPATERGNLRVWGDAIAVRRARSIGRALGMTARALPGLDTVGYHAAAGLVANGAAALAAIGAELLRVSGVPPSEAPHLLGPLLRSVAENVEALGFPGALTGPVRRGDLQALIKHLGILEARATGAIPLYLASIHAQIPLAKELAEAPPKAFEEIETWLAARK